MWENFKNSRFVEHVRNSRAVYVTILTLILAVSVLVTITAVSNRAKKKESQDDTPGIEQSNPDSSQSNSPSDDSSSVQPEIKDEGSVSDTGKTDDSDATETSSVPEMALPVVGMIAKGYDSTVQVYSTTMGDYRIHLGLDMLTEDATPVLAAADGVVSQIWEDPMMGTCVAVSHSGDCYTIYKNLNPTLADSITVGSEVKAGDRLGNVGQSAILELAEEPHLHFEMTVGGLSVDPLEYFSEQAMTQLSEAKDTTEVSASVEE